MQVRLRVERQLMPDFVTTAMKPNLFIVAILFSLLGSIGAAENEPAVEDFASAMEYQGEDHIKKMTELANRGSLKAGLRLIKLQLWDDMEFLHLKDIIGAAESDHEVENGIFASQVCSILVANQIIRNPEWLFPDWSAKEEEERERVLSEFKTKCLKQLSSRPISHPVLLSELKWMLKDFTNDVEYDIRSIETAQTKLEQAVRQVPNELDRMEKLSWYALQIEVSGDLSKNLISLQMMRKYAASYPRLYHKHVKSLLKKIDRKLMGVPWMDEDYIDAIAEICESYLDFAEGQGGDRRLSKSVAMVGAISAYKLRGHAPSGSKMKAIYKGVAFSLPERFRELFGISIEPWLQKDVEKGLERLERVFGYYKKKYDNHAIPQHMEYLELAYLRSKALFLERVDLKKSEQLMLKAIEQFVALKVEKFDIGFYDTYFDESEKIEHHQRFRYDLRHPLGLQPVEMFFDYKRILTKTGDEDFKGKLNKVKSLFKDRMRESLDHGARAEMLDVLRDCHVRDFASADMRLANVRDYHRDLGMYLKFMDGFITMCKLHGAVDRDFQRVSIKIASEINKGYKQGKADGGFMAKAENYLSDSGLTPNENWKRIDHSIDETQGLLAKIFTNELNDLLRGEADSMNKSIRQLFKKMNFIRDSQYWTPNKVSVCLSSKDSDRLMERFLEVPEIALSARPIIENMTTDRSISEYYEKISQKLKRGDLEQPHAYVLNLRNRHVKIDASILGELDDAILEHSSGMDLDRHAWGILGRSDAKRAAQICFNILTEKEYVRDMITYSYGNNVKLGSDVLRGYFNLEPHPWDKSYLLLKLAQEDPENARQLIRRTVHGCEQFGADLAINLNFIVGYLGMKDLLGEMGKVDKVMEYAYNGLAWQDAVLCKLGDKDAIARCSEYISKYTIEYSENWKQKFLSPADGLTRGQVVLALVIMSLQDDEDQKHRDALIEIICSHHSMLIHAINFIAFFDHENSDELLRSVIAKFKENVPAEQDFFSLGSFRNWCARHLSMLNLDDAQRSYYEKLLGRSVPKYFCPPLRNIRYSFDSELIRNSWKKASE